MKRLDYKEWLAAGSPLKFDGLLDFSRDTGDSFGMETLPDGIECRVFNIEGASQLKHMPSVQAEQILAKGSKIQSADPNRDRAKKVDFSDTKKLKFIAAFNTDTLLAERSFVEGVSVDLKAGSLHLSRALYFDHLPTLPHCHSVYLNHSAVEQIDPNKFHLLDISNTRYITELKQIQVQELIANNSQLATLHDSFTGFDLDLSHSQIEQLHGGKYGDITASHTPIAIVSSDLKAKSLDLSYTQNLSTLSAIECKTLSLKHSGIREIEKGIKLGRVDLTGTDHLERTLNTIFLKIKSSPIPTRSDRARQPQSSSPSPS